MRDGVLCGYHRTKRGTLSKEMGVVVLPQKGGIFANFFLIVLGLPKNAT